MSREECSLKIRDAQSFSTLQEVSTVQFLSTRNLYVFPGRQSIPNLKQRKNQSCDEPTQPNDGWRKIPISLIIRSMSEMACLQQLSKDRASAAGILAGIVPLG